MRFYYLRKGDLSSKEAMVNSKPSIKKRAGVNHRRNLSKMNRINLKRESKKKHRMVERQKEVRLVVLPSKKGRT